MADIPLLLTDVGVFDLAVGWGNSSVLLTVVLKVALALAFRFVSPTEREGAVFQASVLI